jgi:invasion protein IalB
MAPCTRTQGAVVQCVDSMKPRAQNARKERGNGAMMVPDQHVWAAIVTTTPVPPPPGFGRRVVVALTVMMAALCLSGAMVSGAQAQGAVRSVHGDWQIRCETPPGAQAEQCALFQSVVAEDRANVGITVLVIKTADQKSRLMRVQAPLGVLLPAGLGLKIDQADVGRAGFVRCTQRGCYAEVVMDDALIGKLRTGTTATFFIFQTPEEGIGFPMGLKGFGDGYDKLP